MKIHGEQVGLTLIEILTGVVVLAVLIAVAVPMWRIYQVRAQRAEAVQALLAVQAAQDRHFATHAAYVGDAALSEAPPSGLGLTRKSSTGAYDIELRLSADSLGYAAVATAANREGSARDSRCAELQLDQHGRRSARDQDGVDTSGDCWG